MTSLPEPLARLVEQLQKLPGIGAKSAQRLAFHILRTPREDAERLCDAVRDVKERVDMYREHAPQFKEQLLRCGRVHENLVVLDLRNEETIWCGNRFLIYALYPQCNISIHQMWGRQKQNMVFATGKSILDRSCTTNVGELMLRYGGGGHHAAGTCQVDTADGERVLSELIAAINADHHAAIRQRRSA